jgi:DNA primase
MIDHQTVERIFDAAQIMDVVQDFVSLRRRGANYLGVCPFHNEKTPSFTVSPAKGIYKCFGCGKGGNSVNFIMEHESLSYYDALKYLAKKYNIEIVEKELSTEERDQQNERESMLLINEWAAKFFADKLKNDREGQAIGLSYFRERGFRDDTIEKFQLGYSPQARNSLAENGKKAGYRSDYMVKTGLIIERDGQFFDRFSGRVMFPILGLSGKVVGFGGRVMKADKTVAKYLNSPESEIYHKSKVLYGLFQARRAIVQADRCYLVEGYTDVISMHQSGIENVVASSGTSLTTEQIKLIKRFTNNVTILYDGDAAGIKASLRGIDMVLEEGLNVKVLLLPDGEDPDSFARTHSAADFVAFIAENESDFVLFKTRLLLDEAKNDPVKRATLISEIVHSIGIIPDSIIRSVYIRECSTLLKVDERALYTEVNKIRGKKAEEYQAERQQQSSEAISIPNQISQPVYTQSPTEQQEKELVRLLIKYGSHIILTETDPDSGDEISVSLAEYIIEDFEMDQSVFDLSFENSLYNEFYAEFKHGLQTHHIPDLNYFTRHPDENKVRLVADLVAEPYQLSKMWRKNEIFIGTEEDQLRTLTEKVMLMFKKRKIVSVSIRLQEQILKSQLEGEDEHILELLGKLITLNNLRKLLSEE